MEASASGFQEVEEALDRLATTHERAAVVVALRVFGGLTVEQVAGELDVSERTVQTDWSVAQTLLQKILNPR